jgi:hypothetical protein
MSRATYKTLAWLLWLAPAAIALRYWQVWDQLPERVASHFDASGRANGWMPRLTSAEWTLGFLCGLAALFTVVLYFGQRKYELAKLSWVLLAFFHAEIWTIAYGLNSTIDYSLYGTPIAILPLFAVTLVGITIVTTFALAEKRGMALSRSELLAEEVHAGKQWSIVLLVPVIGFAWVSLVMPNSVARLTLVAAGAVMAGAVAMAWDGFHCYFSRRGVEIRTLGFRLKSIPLMQIKSYTIDDWSPIGGYGIRGIGNCKAYVWGKTGVRVQMYDGEVFLGHSDPERIVHDLNVMKSHQHS